MKSKLTPKTVLKRSPRIWSFKQAEELRNLDTQLRREIREIQLAELFSMEEFSYLTNLYGDSEPEKNPFLQLTVGTVLTDTHAIFESTEIEQLDQYHRDFYYMLFNSFRGEVISYFYQHRRKLLNRERMKIEKKANFFN